MGFAQASPFKTIMPMHSSPTLTYTSMKRFRVASVKLNGDNDPLLPAATASASLRYHESLRPEPLFVDPYAACFVPVDIPNDMNQDLHPYCLATKFIDDKLLHTVSHIDGLKQLVLLTDGMDTRPYRLNWPTSTIIFYVSPERVFKTAAEKLKAVGAKIPKGCMFHHIPSESSDIEHSLQCKGYNGNRPSVWAIQGFPVMTPINFEKLLSIISSLAMKGSFFVGEFPAWSSGKDIGIEVSLQWVDKLFLSKGFRVEIINYEGVTKSFGKDITTAQYNNILFVAEQLQHSDVQMEIWRREFQRLEDEGDEEGFEEL